METGYWQSMMGLRAKRRKVLVAGATAAASALFLAACGGGDSSGGKSDISSLITPPKDETKSAKPGGVMKAAVVSVTPNLDPHLATGGGAGAPVSRLFRVKPGVLKNTTGHGISLTDTRNVSLDQMNIVNTANDGINGSSVTNFNFTNSTVSGAGDGANEFGVFITNLLGTNTVNNSSITNSETQNLRVLNNVAPSAR